ncbi:MAG: c-type cytochrome [Pseudomonadota bacterium]
MRTTAFPQRSIFLLPHRFLTVCLVMLSLWIPQGLTADAERGQTLTQACVACHGEDGNSIAGSFPSIAGQGERYLLKQLQEIKSGARAAPLMAGQLDSMSDQDLADMAAYYASQTATGGAAKADLVEVGETIYRAGISRKGIAACSSCHGPDGSGNDSAIFPALSGQWPEYTIAQLKAFRSEARANDGDAKMMRSITLDMSDKEMEAVASFLYGLR